MTPSVPAIAIYPGSFDPVTLGHEDVARRTLRVADRLVIAVAHSATHAKQPLFTLDERVAILREVFAQEPRVECTSFDGLLVDFARAREARFIVRGLRAVSDFEYEFQMAQMNQGSLARGGDHLPDPGRALFLPVGVAGAGGGGPGRRRVPLRLTTGAGEDPLESPGWMMDRPSGQPCARGRARGPARWCSRRAKRPARSRR